MASGLNSVGYKTIVFDCDGVVLDSNRIKTDAFRQAASSYGEDAAAALVEHHVANGGISRFAKFRHFLDHIVDATAQGPGLEELLQRYGDAVRQGLSECAVAPGLEQLRSDTKEARWLIVSGGAQAELRDIFGLRGLADWFDGGIFGSPDNKDEILSREIARENIVFPALFIGDSKYDFEAASRASLDFRFATYWTEVHDWRDFVAAHDIQAITGLSELSHLTI